MTATKESRLPKNAVKHPQEQQGDFSVRSSGNIGQEILDRDGKVVAWTTDVLLARRITLLLNRDE
jgi:hypothetical protein